jgi:hypothetical protein
LKVRGAVLLAALLSYGTLLRAWDLDGKPYRVDEAESSINALTILRHGVPVDHYLGLPLYENTLIRPWPESAEYEFKDSSYSERGVAVYHGWLPLYVLAAAYAVAGIGPDTDPAEARVVHSPEEIRRRTWVGRLPGVAFGVIFLLALFTAAREWYGMDAAWAALAAGAVCEPAIFFARQARYYAPSLALGACAAVCIGRVTRLGRWRDFLSAALVAVFLFHTHILSCLALGAATVLAVPRLARHPRFAAKTALALAIIVAGTVPWIVGTGFVATAAEAPRAWSLLTAADFLDFVCRLGPFPVLAALAGLWLAAAGMLRGRLPNRVVRPFADRTRSFLFVAAWGVVAVVGFVGWTPAASYFYPRLLLTALVPALLGGSMFFAAVARVLTPRYAPVVASGLYLCAFAAAGQATWWGSKDPGTPFRYDFVEQLRRTDFPAGTRFFASPNYHLTLTFYTGIPVQSTAPIRKTFFDRFPGELVIIEAGPRYESLTPAEIRDVARGAGLEPTDEQIRSWEARLDTRLLREELGGEVARLTPRLECVPAFLGDLLQVQRRKTERVLTDDPTKTMGNPMFKGLPFRDYLTCWQFFYYRFVHPESRTGPRLNYAGRLRDASAEVLPGEWVIYRCPATPPD